MDYLFFPFLWCAILLLLVFLARRGYRRLEKEYDDKIIKASKRRNKVRFHALPKNKAWVKSVTVMR